MFTTIIFNPTFLQNVNQKLTYTGIFQNADQAKDNDPYTNSIEKADSLYENPHIKFKSPILQNFVQYSSLMDRDEAQYYVPQHIPNFTRNAERIPDIFHELNDQNFSNNYTYIEQRIVNNENSLQDLKVISTN